MGLRESIAGVRPFAEISRRPTTIVYKGYDPVRERFVLLKVLRPEFAAQPDVLETFRNEARLLARVTHPNVVEVHAHGLEQNTAYLITEYVEGKTLAELVADSRLSAHDAANITLSIARGLGAAHNAGVLHRDLKPDNVLVSEEGEVKLTDFGLAVAADGLDEASPRIAGTLRYLAPEVLQGAPPSIRSDLFSCGATFFEILMGHPAFGGEDDGQVIDAVLHRNPMRDIEQFSSAPAGLIVICGRLLRKNPEDRAASCDEVVGQLDQWLAGHAAESAELVSISVKEGAARRLGTPVTMKPVPKLATDRNSVPVGRKPIRWVVAATLGVVVVPAVALMLMREPARSDLASDVMSTPAAPVQDEPTDTLTQPPVEFSLPQTVARPVTDSHLDAVDPDEDARSTLVTSSQNELSLAPSPALAERSVPEESYDDRTADLESVPIGILSVRSVPWAEVWIDGVKRATTNGDSIELPPGQYEMVLRNPEFPDYRQQLAIEPGDRKALDVSLWATVARLNITVIPWAEVVVDGVVLDTIPPQKRPIILPPGTHRLTLRHPELGQIERDVLLRAGEERTLAYNLREASEQ